MSFSFYGMSRLVSKCTGLQFKRSGFKNWKGVIVFCSLAKHLTSTVSLTTQEYKWVLAIVMKTYSITSLPLGGQLVIEWYPIQVGDVYNTPWHYGNQNNDDPLGSSRDLIFFCGSKCKIWSHLCTRVIWTTEEVVHLREVTTRASLTVIISVKTIQSQ